MKKFFRLFYICLGLLSVSACIPEIIPPEAFLDTPSRHVKNGMKLLRTGKIDAPSLEFKRALELDDEYAPAWVGLALVYGLKGDYTSAMEKMAAADLYTRDRMERAMVHVGFMRVYLMGRENLGENWLSKIEQRYEKAILIAPELPEAYFFMGLAYKMSFKFDKASELFLHVIEMDKDYASEAADEYDIILNFERNVS